MRYILQLLFLLVFTSVFAQKPSLDKIPSWVNEVSYQTNIKNEEAESGYYYLLYDKQFNIPKETSYSHSAVKILNNEGVNQMSDLTFEFDPIYEKLIFHKIDIIRNGERISKLNLNSIETIQRESNLERNLYDGRLTSFVNLNDIRKGDILDYSYSIVGSNPIYEGGYSNILYFQYIAPIREIYFRILVPDNETFKFKYFNQAAQPIIVKKDNLKEYEWNVQNIDAQFYDSNTPAWYDDTPYVQFGNYESWEAVVNQYKSFYNLSNKDKESLKRLSQQNISIKDIPKSKEEIVKSLVEFVQDDIRYFGFENGLNSHRPESPLKVLEQRYGDCKGKSFLLSELLQVNGIEAYPMLVHSSNGKTLTDKLPTPNLFDHCVVTYDLDGESFYIDPTMSNQGSTALGKYFPNYEKGLVLKEGEKALKEIEFRKQNGIEVSEHYDIESINGGGTLNVITTYKGNNADMVRADFAKRSNASIQKDYLQFYSALYPDIKEATEIEIEDLRDSKNEFIVRESYRIDSMWMRSPENEKLLYFEAYPLVLENYVMLPKSPDRTAPYYINYPLDVSLDISVNLPEEWEFEDYENEIESDYFSYSQNVSSYERKLLITHNYKIKKDFVQAKDVRKYLSDHEKVQEDLSYFITYDLGTASAIENSGLSWGAILLVIITVLLGVYFSYRLYYEYDIPAKVEDKIGKSLGGWLILVSIGLIFTPLVLLYGLISEESYYDAYTWSGLWNIEGPGGKPFVFLITFELIVNYIRLVFSVLVIILFFQRRTIVPRLMVIMYAATLIFLILDTAASLILAPDLYTVDDNIESFKDIGGAFLRCVIWIPYFLISTRVKETFVKRSPNYKDNDTIGSDSISRESSNRNVYNSLESQFDNENKDSTI